MADETFTVRSVDDVFNANQGLVMLYCDDDRHILVRDADYIEARRRIAHAEMVLDDVATVSLVGRMLVLDDDGVPVRVPASN